MRLRVLRGVSRVGLILILTTMLPGFERDLCAENVIYSLIPEKSPVHFYVQTNVLRVHGITHSVSSKILFDNEAKTPQIPVIAEVMVESFKTGSGFRDQSIHRMFQSAEYPVMHFRAVEIQCDDFKVTDRGVCKLEGVLRIRNIEKTVQLEAEVDWQDSQMIVKGKSGISIENYQLKPPRFLGLLSVKDRVEIEFYTVWEVAVGEKE